MDLTHCGGHVGAFWFSLRDVLTAISCTSSGTLNQVGAASALQVGSELDRKSLTRCMPVFLARWHRCTTVWKAEGIFSARPCPLVPSREVFTYGAGLGRLGLVKGLLTG
jgi:hypothetical protein